MEKINTLKKAFKYDKYRMLKTALAYFLKKIELRNSKLYDRKVIFTNVSLSRNINLFGFYERDELEILIDFLNNIPGFKFNCFIDIGANIGNHSSFFANYFDEIYCFEPHPLIFKILEINTSNFNAKCFNIALGETNEVLDLHIGSSNLGNNSLVFVENSLETISVKVDKLDAF